jgi:plastocyanin
MSGGCENSPLRREKTIDIGDDTVTLAKGVRIVDVRVGGQANPEFEPPAARARPGDVVRFTTADSRTHLLEFDAAALPPAAEQRLRSKVQLRSPPLLTQGVAWIVSLDSLPAGEYPFRCLTHDAAGRLTLR